MENLKIRVKDEDHNRQVQEYLFSLGYRWPHNVSDVNSFGNGYFLYAYESGDIRYGSLVDLFETHPNKEVVFVFKPSFEEAKKRVEVFGVTYFEDDVKEALQKLSPAV